MDFIKSRQQLVRRRLHRESRKTQSEDKESVFLTVFLHCIYIWHSLMSGVKNVPVSVMSSLSAAQTSVCLLHFGACSSLIAQRPTPAQGEEHARWILFSLIMLFIQRWRLTSVHLWPVYPNVKHKSVTAVQTDRPAGAPALSWTFYTYSIILFSAFSSNHVK